MKANLKTSTPLDAQITCDPSLSPLNKHTQFENHDIMTQDQGELSCKVNL